jgi:UDP-glucose 4-epimerase
VSPYGETKLAAERMISDQGAVHGLRSVCLRYFNACGADPDGEIGEDHSPETHLIPLVMDAALGERPAISVFGTDYRTPDGTAIRDYIHVCDLASAHLAAMRHLLNGGDSEVMNLGTGSGVSVAQLIEEARRVTGSPILSLPDSRRAGDPPVLVADPSRARDVLGWEARHSDLQTILVDAWNWHRQRFGNPEQTAVAAQ